MMALQCELCPRRCVLGQGERGSCRVRVNLDGKLVSLVYGFPCAMHIDPVEKKPLYHFLPGTSILSLATAGCNLHCLNCQNWEISQLDPEDGTASQVPPQTLLDLAKKHGCPSIAYTYTDPVIYYEYALESSRIAKENGIKNVLVTAGYINIKPWKRLLEVTDAANIDLKGITNEFYEKVCSATLRPVLDSLVAAREAGIVLEVTHLIIPTLNDNPRDTARLCRWIRENLGPDTPVHFSRFHPRYKMRNLPPTPSATLDRAYEIAHEAGLEYVYIGNILTRKGQDTICPGCSQMLVSRSGFKVRETLVSEGKCPKCGKEIPGLWK
ncbi:MAG: AmmeMemoRadiSam system radical SAM enzyme [Victivallales bacterium]|nr:AmmeMemoRadiSam system radical SAM enzyme [Victivallales bacterium]